MIKSAINRPVAVSIVIVALLILGYIGAMKVSVELFPDIEMPVLSVMVSYDGAGPKEVEQSVVEPLEGVLGSIPGLDSIVSVAREESGFVMLNFKWGEDIDARASDVREKIDLIRDRLPDGVSSPMVLKFDPSLMPTMVIALSGSPDLMYLRDVANDRIKNILSQVDGVANVEVEGGVQKQVMVYVSKEKLNAYMLDLNSIVRAIASENQDVPAGVVYEGNKEFILRVVGKFKTLKDIENTVITVKGGIPVRVKDVANVKLTLSEETGVVKLNGKPAVLMWIYKQSGESSVDVSKNVNEKMKEINEEMRPLKLIPIFDSAEFIEQSISGVWRAAIQGGIIAILVLFIYLWSVRTVTVIGFSIPISIIATFILMYYLGVNINIISLSGFALGIGMMVDNSIVVLENTFRHREDGYAPKEAAYLGAKEVAMAITASTFTTIAVFFPITFVQGLAAELFRDLAMTVSISLFVSLLVALTLVPMLGARFAHVPVIRSKIGLFFQRILNFIEKEYSNALHWSLRHKKLVVGLVFLAFVVSVFMFPLLGKELMAGQDQAQVFITAKLPIGTRLEVSKRVAEKIEDVIEKSVPEVENTIVRIKSGSGIAKMFLGLQSYKIEIRLKLVPRSQRERSIEDIVEDLRHRLEWFPGELRVSTQGKGGSMMFGSGAQLEIKVKGNDLDADMKIAEKVKNIMEKVDGVRNAHLDVEDRLPEIQITINREKASRLGLSSYMVAKYIQTGVKGTFSGYYRKSGKDYEIIVRLDPKDRQTIEDIKSLYIPSPTGKLVPIVNIADVKQTLGPTVINREDRVRVVTVKAEVYGRDEASVVEEIKDKVSENVVLPAGVTISYEGTYKEMKETFADLTLAFALAVFLVFAVMAVQFESLTYPFIIMFSVPFAFSGVVWTFLLTNTTFNVMGFAGLIMLVGIVVNNAIVLVDYTNKLRERGMELYEAVERAGKRRLRPVSMTTLTTVLAMIPMALGMSEGGELYSPMARAVMGGLLISTIFTLIFVPVVYTGFTVLKNRWKNKLQGLIGKGS